MSSGHVEHILLSAQEKRGTGGEGAQMRNNQAYLEEEEKPSEKRYCWMWGENSSETFWTVFQAEPSTGKDWDERSHQHIV